MPKYLLKASYVSRSLASLRSGRIHPHFVAYLCLKRTAARFGRTENLQPDFREFFDTFLRVHDAPKTKPYLRLFLDETASESNRWLNANLAGSFAPSSLRGTLQKVVDVSGTKRKAFYSLRPGHWQLAKIYLAQDTPIPVVDLAIVLYRDFAIESQLPSVSRIVEVFREEFGYGSSAPEVEEFQSIYVDDSQTRLASEWLEST